MVGDELPQRSAAAPGRPLIGPSPDDYPAWRIHHDGTFTSWPNEVHSTFAVSSEPRHSTVLGCVAMHNKAFIGAAAVVATGLTAVGLGGPAGADATELTPVAVFDSGDGDGGAEIVAIDTSTEQMYVTNGVENQIDVVDISDPTAPVAGTPIDLSPYGAGVQSVAAHTGLMAAAVESERADGKGRVVVFDSDGNLLGNYLVGVLPDSIAFTPDGSAIVVANEAEPVCVDDKLKRDPNGSISIIRLDRGQVRTANFARWNDRVDELLADGVRIFFPGSTVAQDLEPEYVAVSADSSTAFVTLQENNAVAVVDIASAKVTDILPLGYKDHSLVGNGLDPSNENLGAVITTEPILGMYMPDAIAVAELEGATHLLTANEGDARDYDCYSEEIRVKDFESGEGTLVGGVEALGLVVPPYGVDDLDDENLGRLKTTTAFPTMLNGDDQVDQIYAYGARSFTIWAADGSVVFDSGDDFEQITAPTPWYADNRADDKGPEPEALTVGEVDGKTYAFIGLERTGGIMMYDITDPNDALFVDYANTNDLGDISPEGIVFFEDEGTPYLAVSFEVSGTTRIFEIETD